MGILDIASGNSVWRGYDYYENKRVLSYKLVSNTLIKGVVLGSSGENYKVVVDVAHPKRSLCDCPHAEGANRICKHKVAVYFTAFPDSVCKFLEDARSYEDDEAAYAEQLECAVVESVRKMKKSELVELALDLLFTGPDWQFNRFVDQHVKCKESESYDII